MPSPWGKRLKSLRCVLHKVLQNSGDINSGRDQRRRVFKYLIRNQLKSPRHPIKAVIIFNDKVYINFLLFMDLRTKLRMTKENN
jgi:hypothetical protein